MSMNLGWDYHELFPFQTSTELTYKVMDAAPNLDKQYDILIRYIGNCPWSKSEKKRFVKLFQAALADKVKLWIY